MTDGIWRVGNAASDGQDRRGWIVGHFHEHGDIRCSEDVEIKWGVHGAGEQRAAWHETEHRTTVLLLVRGRFQINLADQSFVLSQEGDYAMWGPGVSHWWQAEEDSVVVTIRWPSIP